MRLLKLEMKRVLKTRLTFILLLVSFMLAFVMAYLPSTFSYHSYIDENGNVAAIKGLASIRYTQNLQSEIAGEVTSEKVRQAVENYQACLTKYGVEDSYNLPEGVYGTEILPYAPLLRGVKEAFADHVTGMAPSMMEIDPEEIDDYYAVCKEHLQAMMKMEQKNNSEAQRNAITMYDTVKKPYLFFPGYTRDAMDYQILLAFLLLIICTVIAAPIFTSDYQSGADDILRCTKHGRAKFAVTKIASAFLICGTVFVLCAAIYILVSNSIFGWESTKTSVQMLYSIVNLPDMNLNQLQYATAILGGLSIMATVSFTLFLSSRCKNMVASLSAALAFCLLPLIVYMALPAGIGEWICGILPSSGAGIQTSGLYEIIDFNFLKVGNIALWIPHVMLWSYIIEIPLFSVLAVYAYSKRQVN